MEKLRIEQIEVPEGMLKAFILARYGSHASNGDSHIPGLHRMEIAAALLWLAENPIVPTDGQCEEMIQSYARQGDKGSRNIAIEWQRHMFLKREPELPAEVKALLWSARHFPDTGSQHRHDEAVRKAYELGKQAKS